MLYLRADSLKENGFYVRFLGEMKMAELLPAKPQSTGKVSERDTDAEVKDSQLVMENGRYFLCVPYVEKKKPRKPSGRIVALDPGVRDFMTFFSEDSFGWLGRQCINRIQRLCQHSDNLLSRATREQRPLRRALRKAAKSIKVKIRNLIKSSVWRPLPLGRGGNTAPFFLTNNVKKCIIVTYQLADITGAVARLRVCLPTC